MRTRIHALVIGALCLFGTAAMAAPAKADIDPRADQLMKKMSDFLAQQQSFTVKPETTLEVVDDDGQKIQLHRDSALELKRPNKLRADRSGDLADTNLFYDGKTLTVIRQGSNLYASAPAPGTIDAMMDMTEERLGLVPPGADLLTSSPYDAMMTTDITLGRYLGMSMIDGVKVHQLAFKGADTDWQIWIQDGAQPLPRKLVVTSKKQKQAPEYEVVLRDWKLNPALNDADFTFNPPKDAQRISFLGAEKGGEKTKAQGRKGAGR